MRLVEPVVEVVRKPAPRVPIRGPNRSRDRPGLYTQVLSDALAPWRYQATLVGVFAGLALILTGAGLYGVLSSAVGRERHSIVLQLSTIESLFIAIFLIFYFSNLAFVIGFSAAASEAYPGQSGQEQGHCCLSHKFRSAQKA